MLTCWGARLGFWRAARIWSVSNLGRYLPGKIWQIGIMAAMARDSGISPLAASGSAILGTLVNVLAGLAVALATGRVLLERTSRGREPGAIGLVLLASVALLGLPWLIPRLAPLAARVLRRPVQAMLPVRAIGYAVIGNVTAWLLYGAAFDLFTRGVLGEASGGYPQYLAAYTVSYLAGYLMLFAPAGIGVREGMMVTALTHAGLATAPQAALVALTSRVWLTVLEVVPGFLFWAHATTRRRPPTSHRSDVPT